jgi:hypothetical protein
VIGFILEVFIGFFLRGMAATWINLGFLLLANRKIAAGLIKLAI